MQTQNAVKILDAVATAATAGEKHRPRGKDRTFQLTGFTSAGVGAAAVKVQASNDGINWIDMATISLTLGTGVTTDGFTSQAAWKYVRGYVDTISGIDAQVDLWLGA